MEFLNLNIEQYFLLKLSDLSDLSTAIKTKKQKKLVHAILA